MSAFRYPEVCYVGGSLAIQQYVARLEVVVDDTTLVNSFQTGEDLIQKCSALLGSILKDFAIRV